MTSPRPTFRVMKNGYDRFAVDDAVDRYASRVDQLERKLTAYQQQLDETNARFMKLQTDYQNLENSVDAQRQAAENIARLSLREANEIIETARQNADAIIRESLITARLILTDLSKLYGDANEVKTSTLVKLDGLIKELEEFELPKMPDLRWLRDAEEKMMR
ncbi:MAG: DivIVA domain-containing protein [Solobacterium sp.]|nr:DivIVA domain-containing protein [Solobacterium sp.]MBR3347725.1 DivIVA domain-containing protein [Solobacterium sp.]